MSAFSQLAFVNSTFGWLVVLFLALLLFGSRLPGVARNLGKGINQFKKGLSEGGDGDGGDGGELPARSTRTPASPSGVKSNIDDTSV